MGLHNDTGTLIGDDYSIEAYARHGLDLVKDFTAAVDGVEYDTIVVTGLSGVLWGARVAEYLGRNLMIIRKPSDVHHSDFDAEGYLGKRWIFADDFVSAGDTLFRVWKYMHDYHPEAEFLGLFEYAVYGDGQWIPNKVLMDGLGDGLGIGHEWAAQQIHAVLDKDTPQRHTIGTEE